MVFSDSYTVENVLQGHPDKICDQISDYILDKFLERDPYSHTAIECMGTGQKIIVAGEVSSSARVDIVGSAETIYKEITKSNRIQIEDFTSSQSQQLQNGMLEGGAGDQGIMYGYACNNNNNFLPYGVWIASIITRRMNAFCNSHSGLGMDGKIQVKIEEGKLDRITINVQHQKDYDLYSLRKSVNTDVLFDIDAKEISINEIGEFVQGGIINDTGLTGRKIAADTYGGLIPFGGGAFSGKDPSKVDRSAAYMCRYVAKNVVANNEIRECLISVAYEFAKAQPSMLHVFVDGKENPTIESWVREKFDFRPEAIIERLQLRSQKYFLTSRNGHFANPSYAWEHIESI